MKFLRNIIINFIKNLLRKVNLYNLACNMIDYFYYPKGSTIIIHVGKTGGTSLGKGLREIRLKEKNIYRVHVRKPLYRKDLKYIFMIRHPVSRVISAFRFRYDLVVKNKIKGLKGEYQVLLKYKTINNIACDLYLKNGELNKKVSKEIKSILHINQDISYYLENLLNKCKQNQIIGVLTQENLNQDIEKILNYKNNFNERVMEGSNKDAYLSEKAFINLLRFLESDYQIIYKLFLLQKLEKTYFLKCLKKV